jgi:hypothetical protein
MACARGCVLGSLANLDHFDLFDLLQVLQVTPSLFSLVGLPRVDVAGILRFRRGDMVPSYCAEDTRRRDNGIRVANNAKNAENVRSKRMQS